MNEPIHIISLGAGVQSSTMSLMAAAGEITPMPKCAIFADTQAEPKSVYTWLDWLEKQLPFPVHRVSKGNLEDASVRVRRSRRSGKLYMWALVPAFLKQIDGSVGMMGRKCTGTFKVEQILRKLREVAGVKRGKLPIPVQQWIGISTDEALRQKDSLVSYVVNRYPLLELNMSRRACLAWMDRNGFPKPPKSACRGCPFHSDAQWAEMKRDEPDEFLAAVEWESRMQAAVKTQEVLRGNPFLHRSCVPLSQVNFTEEKHGYHQIDMFNNECEGMCGV